MHYFFFFIISLHSNLKFIPEKVWIWLSIQLWQGLKQPNPSEFPALTITSTFNFVMSPWYIEILFIFLILYFEFGYCFDIVFKLDISVILFWESNFCQKEFFSCYIFWIWMFINDRYKLNFEFIFFGTFIFLVCSSNNIDIKVFKSFSRDESIFINFFYFNFFIFEIFKFFKCSIQRKNFKYFFWKYHF